ncbi:MAG: sulfotransferase family protein [Gammaproteobacteria bacterium]
MYMRDRVKRYFCGPFETYLYLRSHRVKHHQRIIIVVGSQRSGTTLLGLILSAHPQVTMYDEDNDTSYRLLRSGKFAATAVCGFKCPAYTHRYQMLGRMYPDAKYLFITRNIMSIVSSMLEYRLGDGRRWVETVGHIGLVRLLATVSDRGLKRIVRQQLRQCEAANDYVGIAAMYAYVQQYFLAEYERTGLSVCHVVYENLVLHPAEEVPRIVQFLDIPWVDNLLRHHRQSEGLAPGNTERNRPIDTGSLDKWRAKLQEGEISRITQCVSLLQNRSGNLRGDVERGV